ncbi:MAG TPA: TIR domain-containing protein [Urbifossiella sp.]|nr:TIR domain-containing protein [Urbifossiella sp.]
MRNYPEWGVQVSDYAFNILVQDYTRIRKCKVLNATTAIMQNIFVLGVLWRRRSLNLLMWDMGGEICAQYAGTGEMDPDLEAIIIQSRCILFPIPAWYLSSGTNSMWGDGPEQDASFAMLFRRLIQKNCQCRQVVVLLVGSDAFGKDPVEAHPRMLGVAKHRYRLFPGVLKNAGIEVEWVPITHIGYGNEITTDGIKYPPLPHNVLEPLRRVIPHFFPEERPALASNSLKDLVAKVASPSPLPDRATASAFLSYRRDGGAVIARLIRNELISRGWRVFLDVEDLGGSFFDDRLLLEITNTDALILVLSPGSLDRCSERTDWLRREVSHALLCQKRIVPLKLDGFTYPTKEVLPLEMHELLRFNSVEYSHTFFQATMDKLAHFLSDQSGQGLDHGLPVTRWRCEYCGHRLRARRSSVGKKGRCPGCMGSQYVP